VIDDRSPITRLPNRPFVSAVSIKASSSKEIDALVAQLGEAELACEAAVARLSVIGARAVERLTALAASTAPAPARAAAFRTLEAIADPRALDPALRAIADADATVATAAIRAAQPFLRGPRGAEVVDAFTQAALDGGRAEPIRLAALGGLSVLERSTIAPLLTSLSADPNGAVREAARTHRTSVRRDKQEGWERQDGRKRHDQLAVLTHAAGGMLPDDPVVLRDAIGAVSGTIAPAVVLAVIERVRERESSDPAARPGWMTARAAAHLALAQRGSRVALYDIRESVAAADAPLPVELLAALSLVGDASCLEAIAGAYARSCQPGRPHDDWWRRHLVDAFRTIATREKITRRHTVMKKILKRWPAVISTLWRTTPRPSRRGRSGRTGRLAPRR